MLYKVQWWIEGLQSDMNLEQHDEQHLKEKEDMMVQTDTLRQHNQVQMKT